MTLRVLQHTSAEYLGLMEDHLEGRNIRFQYSRPFAGKGAMPKPEQLDEGLILLGGGPWGSAGTRDVPTLAEEVALARSALAKNLPVLGIGLGAQILALAAGGRTESILMSMPPAVTWRYGWTPAPGSPEAKLYTDFLKPRDWV